MQPARRLGTKRKHAPTTVVVDDRRTVLDRDNSLVIAAVLADFRIDTGNLDLIIGQQEENARPDYQFSPANPDNVAVGITAQPVQHPVAYLRPIRFAPPDICIIGIGVNYTPK